MSTKVCYRQDPKDNFIYITIKDHANYSDKGQDIVCAAISAITNGTVNFLKVYYKSNCKVSYLPAKITIYSQNNNLEYQLCLRLMFYQLENLANYYPNYLKIIKE